MDHTHLVKGLDFSLLHKVRDSVDLSGPEITNFKVRAEIGKTRPDDEDEDELESALQVGNENVYFTRIFLLLI